MKAKVNKLMGWDARGRRKSLEKDQILLNKNIVANKNKCFHQDERGTRAAREESVVNGKTYKWKCTDCGEPLEHRKIELADLNNAMVTIRDAVNQSKQSLNKRSYRDMAFGYKLVVTIESLPLLYDFYNMIMYENRTKKKGGRKRGNVHRG